MNAVSILGVVAAFFLLFLSTICLFAEHGILPMRRATRRFRRFPLFGKLLIAIIVGVWIAFGGGKNDLTNSPPLGMMGPPMTMVGQMSNVVITEAETNAGYRVESIVEGDGIVPFVTATTNDLWRLRGGMADARRMENGKWKAANPGGDDSVAHWYFPYHDTFTDGLTVFANGEFRPNAKTVYFPKPFDAVLSLVPQVKWGQIANGGPSLFTHELTPSNSLMLSWQNALYNRDANCPTNFQAELFADGKFEYRYQDRTVRYAPVFPFDWDGDGMENSVDDCPLVAADTDAHGTNAEWYDTICSNVFTRVELPDNANSIPVLLPNGESVYFRPGVNTNAYYFVDVVAERGPAPVYFNADRDSRLGSPVVVANVGETNRVPLLIGVEYAVTSSVPIAVSVPDAEYAVATTNNIRSVTMKWPLEFVFTEDVEGSNRVYTVTADPYDPGGAFSWDDAVSGGATLQGTTPAPACGCVTCSGNRVVFGCSADCNCGGNCTARGIFSFEYTTFMVIGGECRCGFDDPAPESFPSYTVMDSADMSITFSKPAVIFEDAYEDSPGVTRERRSTRVRLTVSAYGGPRGATIMFASSNLNRLHAVGAGYIDLTTPKFLAAGESLNMSCVFEGFSASEAQDDIEVDGYIVENGVEHFIPAQATLTSVKVELMPQKRALLNQSANRHTFGVYELVDCFHEPLNIGVLWTLHGGGVTNNAPEGYAANQIFKAVLRCPLTNSAARIVASYRNVEYSPMISFREPENIVAENIDYNFVDTRYPGEAGAIAMKFDLYVHPQFVSFEEIALQEVPWRQGGSATGYFNLPAQQADRYHDVTQGAGRWNNVTTNNYWSIDRVGYKRIETWCAGTRVWDIPIGWNIKGRRMGDPEIKIIGVANMFQMETTLSTNGTVEVKKFGHRVSREVSENPDQETGRVFLDGVEQNWREDIKRWLKELENGDTSWQLFL